MTCHAAEAPPAYQELDTHSSHYYAPADARTASLSSRHPSIYESPRVVLSSASEYDTSTPRPPVQAMYAPKPALRASVQPQDDDEVFGFAIVDSDIRRNSMSLSLSMLRPQVCCVMSCHATWSYWWQGAAPGAVVDRGVREVWEDQDESNF